MHRGSGGPAGAPPAPAHTGKGAASGSPRARHRGGAGTHGKGDSMRSTRSATRGCRRAAVLALATGVLVVVATSFAGASAASGPATRQASATAGYPTADAGQPWAYQRFLASSQADV